MIDESVKAKIYELEEAATKDYNDSPFADEYLEGYLDGLRQAAKELSTAPTVDAVPVVRCGECKRHEEPRDTGLKAFVWCNFYNMYKLKDGYCNCGERKDGERKDDEH